MRPSFLGARQFKAYPLAELVPYIDWTPFSTWELVGKYPRILDDNVVGGEARKLFADAEALLARLVAGNWLTANAVIGFWPSHAVGDDIELYDDEGRSCGARRYARCASRWRAKTCATGRTPRSPTSWRRRRAALPITSVPFAVTTGVGEAEALSRYIDQHDDYGRIMLKALADRLAEAFAGAYARARTPRILGLRA